MRSDLYLGFLAFLLVFAGCKQKTGIHEIVEIDAQKKATEELYIEYLSDLIERYPDEVDNYLKLASIYNSQNSPMKSIVLLERANIENPKNVNVLTSLAYMYLLEEDIDKLSGSLNEIRKIDPDNMDFLKLSAGYSLLLKDYTNAIFFANRAMLANPYDDENYYLRGRAQLIHKDSLNALISFEEAYKLKNSFRNFSEIFDVALATGNTDKARMYMDEISSRNPDQQMCYQWGAYLNEIGREDTAIVILMSCLMSMKEEERINFEIAKYYYKSNKIDSTLHYINNYLATEPKGTEAYVLKAWTLEKISYYTEAKKLYNNALEIDSTSILASRGLENLERKVAYLRLVKRKEEVQRQVETLKPLDSKEIN